LRSQEAFHEKLFQPSIFREAERSLPREVFPEKPRSFFQAAQKPFLRSQTIKPEDQEGKYKSWIARSWHINGEDPRRKVMINKLEIDEDFI
jgi:hypothetical protein